MKRRQRLLALALLLHAALTVLMALPIGAVLRFAPDPLTRAYKSFAYFDFGVLGMSGNGFPFLTAVLSSVALLLLVWMLCRKKECGRLGTACLACTLTALVTSVLALLLLHKVSAAGIAITGLLLLSACVQGRIRQDERYGAAQEEAEKIGGTGAAEGR